MIFSKNKHLNLVIPCALLAGLAVLFALNYHVFVLENDFAPAGLAGILVMVQYLGGFKISWLNLVINVPLAALCFFFVSRSFAVRSFVFSVVFSGVLLLAEYVDFYTFETQYDRILAVISAGFINGFLYGCAIRLGGSTGGTDLLAALIQARSKLPRVCRSAMDGLAMMTSTLPGMVIGVGFLFAFSGTILQNTIAILILANLVHFFASPYLMGTAALSRMNAGWETTGLLMGDTWIQTIRRVVLPNARATLIEMFELYFINSMVTISAVVFLCGTSTMLLTTKIKEFSYYERFDAIFVLSLLVFVTNVAAKLILDKLAECSRTDQKAGSTRS